MEALEKPSSNPASLSEVRNLLGNPDKIDTIVWKEVRISEIKFRLSCFDQMAALKMYGLKIIWAEVIRRQIKVHRAEGDRFEC